MADDAVADDGAGSAERPLAPVMVYAFDADGVCTLSEGPGLSRIGLSREQLVGRQVREIFAEQPAVLANIERVLAGHRVRNVTVLDGVELDTFIEPQLGPDGRVAGAFGTSVDITGARAHEQRLAFVARRDGALASMSARLAEDSGDVDRVLQHAAQIVADLLGGYAIVWTLDGAGELSLAAHWHQDPDKRGLVDSYVSRVEPGLPLVLAATALEHGRPRALGLADLAAVLSAEAEQVRAEAAVEEVAHAPVMARGETLGVLAVYREPHHGGFTAEDLSLLGDVAGRIGMALANAKLLDELSTANEDLLKFRALADASGDFIGILDVDCKVTYVNPAGRAMLQLPDDGDVSTLELVAVFADAGARERAAGMCHGDENVPTRWDEEAWLAAADGSTVPVAASTFALRHPVTGRPMGIGTVQRDLTRQRQVEERARQLSEQRQALLARQAVAVEAERMRIAADVHDDSVQVLAAVDLRLGLLRRRLVDAAPEQLDLLDRLHADIQEAVGRLRELLFDLEAPARDLTLGDALRHAAARALEDSGIEWVLDDTSSPDLPQSVKTAAYRICQEALANVRRHSQARTVRLTVNGQAGGLLVEVTDDGCGMEPGVAEPRTGHLGLAGMRERADAAGGWWRLDSAPGKGTTVSAWLPVADAAERSGP